MTIAGGIKLIAFRLKIHADERCGEVYHELRIRIVYPTERGEATSVVQKNARNGVYSSEGISFRS